MPDQYTFTGLRTELIRRLGNRTDIEARAGEWLNSAQLQLAKVDLELPRLEATVTQAQLVADQSEYDLRALVFIDTEDLLGIRAIRNETSRWLLRRFPWAEYRTLHTQAKAAPVRWARHGDRVAVDPMPDRVYALRIDYRRRPRPDVLEVDSEWHDLLLRLGAFIGWDALAEPALAAQAFARLPALVQMRLQVPLGQDEWEAAWDEGVGLVPA